ncbi:Diacylglycerol kinase [Lithohypha guttulata]|uniref:Diacylglycerol kinase n=1 Tax=Lithohypha guttulata TaxID=1690604 RepID=A0AAN7YJL5_9EURO|nr:Diacylglycerol kinase [Lithohypha guttulata]
MSSPYPVPSTPKVISPSPTPSESSEQADGYFTRSVAKRSRTKSPQPDTIAEEKTNDDSEGSDSSLEKRARTRSRSPILAPTDGIKKSEPLPTKHSPAANGNAIPPQVNGHLSPYSQIKKSWREFSRSPSPLGLIPLHRHYRTFIHKHEIPRKALHVSIGFLTLGLYSHGLQATAITPWLLGLLVPIASVDLLRHRLPAFNRFYVRCLGALMRETEVDGYNGVIWYLLGAYIALRFYPKDIGTMSILLLSWCDTAASTFGRLWGKYTIRLRKGKSLAGTLAAMFTGICAAWFFWGFLAPRTGPLPDDPAGGLMYKGILSLPEVIRNTLGWSKEESTISGVTAMTVMSISTGLIACFSEFVDIFSWDDNLTIPLISSAGLWLFLKAFG